MKYVTPEDTEVPRLQHEGHAVRRLARNAAWSRRPHAGIAVGSGLRGQDYKRPILSRRVAECGPDGEVGDGGTQRRPRVQRRLDTHPLVWHGRFWRLCGDVGRKTGRLVETGVLNTLGTPQVAVAVAVPEVVRAAVRRLTEIGLVHQPPVSVCLAPLGRRRSDRGQRFEESACNQCGLPASDVRRLST